MVEIGDVLFDEQAIAGKVGELAARISANYAGKDPVVVCILKAAVMFFADLTRRISCPFTIDFVQAASYGMSLTSARNVVVKKDLDTDIRGRQVILVDTIIDTGETLAFLTKMLSERGSEGLKSVVLLDKVSRRTTEAPVDYRGFEIPDRFVVGYGMDCKERFRNLPYIAAVKPE